MAKVTVDESYIIELTEKFENLISVCKEMKELKLEIQSLDEMDTCFGHLTVNEIVKRQNAKNRLFYLIDKL